MRRRLLGLKARAGRRIGDRPVHRQATRDEARTIALPLRCELMPVVNDIAVIGFIFGDAVADRVDGRMRAGALRTNVDVGKGRSNAKRVERALVQRQACDRRRDEK